MPKRSNPFQRLIYLIEQQLQPAGFTVEQSAEVTDPDTGEPREVDILISGELGAHRVAMAVEVIAHTRPGDVLWVEKMAAKYDRRALPVHKVILVSKSGFTAPARKKAEALNFECLTLHDAQQADWSREIDTLKTATHEQVWMPWVTHINLELRDNEAVDAMAGVDLKTIVLEGKGGARIGPLKEYATALFHTKHFIDTIQNAPPEQTQFRLVFELQVKTSPIYVRDAAGVARPLAKIQAQAVAHRTKTTIPLARYSFGEAQVSVGEGSLYGEPFEVVAVQRRGEPMTVRWNWDGANPPAPPPMTDNVTWGSWQMLVKDTGDMEPFVIPGSALSLSDHGAYVYNAKHDVEAAERDYLTAIELDPNLAHALGNEAYLLWQDRGDIDAALSYYERAYKADATNLVHLRNYARLLRDSRHDPDTAGEVYRTGLAAKEADAPQRAALLLDYANLQYERGDFHDAARLLEQYVAILPEEVDVVAMWATCQSLSGNHEKAFELYRRVLTQQPSHQAALVNLAQLLFLRGESDEAFHLLDLCLGCHPGGDQEIEAWFYRYAYGWGPQEQALSEVKRLLEAGVRSPGWDLRPTVTDAIARGHPEPDLLRTLAEAITARVE